MVRILVYPRVWRLALMRILVYIYILGYGGRLLVRIVVYLRVW